MLETTVTVAVYAVVINYHRAMQALYHFAQEMSMMMITQYAARIAGVLKAYHHQHFSQSYCQKSGVSVRFMHHLGQEEMMKIAQSVSC